MENKPPGVHHQNRVEMVNMVHSMHHGDNQPSILAGETPQQIGNFTLRPRVKPAGHLVAQQHFRVAGEFHAKCKPAALTPGKHRNPVFPDGFKPECFREPKRNPTPGGGSTAISQPHGVLYGFRHGEPLVRNAKLRHITDPHGGTLRCALVRRLTKAHDRFRRNRFNTCENAEQRTLPAARGTNHSRKMAAGKRERKPLE